MQNPPQAELPQTTEALLEGLVAECHALIRAEIVPAARKADDADRIDYLRCAAQMMETAVKLADAVGRLRGTAPQPELRQRITVERVQGPPAPQSTPCVR